MDNEPHIYAVRETLYPWRDKRMFLASITGGRQLPVVLTAEEINDAQSQGVSLKLMALRKAHHTTGYPVKYRGRLYSTEQGRRRRGELERQPVPSPWMGGPTAPSSQPEANGLGFVHDLPELVLADF